MLYLQLHVGLTQVFFTAIDGFAVEGWEGSCCWVLVLLVPWWADLAALCSCPASSCHGTQRGAELRAYVSRRNPALAFQMKRLKTLTRDNYKRKMNLFLDQKLLCKRVCKLWRAS